MSHDKELIPADHDLTQRQRLYTRFDTGSLIHLTVISAKIRNLVSGLYNDLISTTAKSQIDGHTGMFIVFRVIISHISDTHTEGDRHLISDFDTFDIF